MGLRDTLAALRSARETGQPEALERARAATAAKEWPAAAQAWAEVVATLCPHAPDAEPWRELARARRLDRDLTGAREAVDEGRSRSPDDLGLTVEHARLALRGYAASNEDERHVWKAMLLDAQVGLRAARDRGEVTKPALQAAAEVELVLRRWRDAIELWAELERRYPDRADEAIVKQATALRSAGDLAGARTTLTRLPPSASGESGVKALERLITASEGVESANAAFAAASSRWHAGDTAALAQEMPTILAARGHPARIVELSRPLIAALSALLDGGQPSAPEGRDGSRNGFVASSAVLVCGFLYSGSGAVFDFLRDHPRFHLPFGDKEPGFLKKPGNLATILEVGAGLDVPDPATAADALLATLFGLGQTGRPLVGWMRDDEAVAELIQRTCRLTTDLARIHSERPEGPDGARAATHAALREHLGRTLGSLTPPDRIALLNNAIIGHQLDRVALLPAARAVAVFRDPRDQYVSQRLESPNPLSTEEFIAVMGERFATYEHHLRTSEVAERTIAVSFERFVTDPGHRLALLARLGVPESSLVASGSFRPDISRRNIGIHHQAGLDGDVAQVADALLPAWQRITAPRAPRSGRSDAPR